MQIPIGAEESFAGVVDLVRMKAVVWNGEELGASFEDQEIPEDLVELANEYRYHPASLPMCSPSPYFICHAVFSRKVNFSLCTYILHPNF